MVKPTSVAVATEDSRVGYKISVIIESAVGRQEVTLRLAESVKMAKNDVEQNYPCDWCVSRWVNPKFYGRPGAPCIRCRQEFPWLI